MTLGRVSLVYLSVVKFGKKNHLQWFFDWWNH